MPALTILLGYPLKTAIGTSLAAMIPAALTGVVTECFVSPENLHLEIGAWLAAGAVLGTFGGRWILARLGDSSLRWVYAIFLIFVAMRLLGLFAGPSVPAVSWEESRFLAIGVCLGAGILAGASSTLFGVGGGVIAVPLILLLIHGMTFHEARATSLIMIPAAAAFGVWHHAKLGSLDRAAAWQLGVPACLGAIGGIFLVRQISGSNLQSAFAILLVIAAWRLMREQVRKSS